MIEFSKNILIELDYQSLSPFFPFKGMVKYFIGQSYLSQLIWMETDVGYGFSLVWGVFIYLVFCGVVFIHRTVKFMKSIWCVFSKVLILFFPHSFKIFCICLLIVIVSLWITRHLGFFYTFFSSWNPIRNTIFRDFCFEGNSKIGSYCISLCAFHFLLTKVLTKLLHSLPKFFPVISE